MIQTQFGVSAEVFNVAQTPAQVALTFENIILGASTWGVGRVQYDMESFVSELAGMQLGGKRIALYGLGDQFVYHETYCDGLGDMYSALRNSGCQIVGSVSTEGYDFTASTAVVAGRFVGLALDFENQIELVSPRIEAWVKQLRVEFSLL